MIVELKDLQKDHYIYWQYGDKYTIALVLDPIPIWGLNLKLLIVGEKLSSNFERKLTQLFFEVEYSQYFTELSDIDKIRVFS